MNDKNDDITLRIALGFCQQFPEIIFCDDDKSFYIYENGFYRYLSELQLERMLLDKSTFTRKIPYAQLKTVIKRIATERMKYLEVFNPEGFINLNNGIYVLQSGNLIPHTIDYISTIKLGFDYSQDADCPLWVRTLNEIFEDDQNKVRTIQEYFGYCLTRDVSQEKALIITGEGGTGKSTVLNTLINLIGESNCSFLSLRHFSNPQKSSVLKNKLVNICSEVPKRITDFEAEFRIIVTGESLQVSPKFIPDYTIKPYCKLVLALNEFPFIDDKTNAFYRRLLIVEFNRVFKEDQQDKQLRNKLMAELPGIFNWAIKGLKSLQNRGFFVIDEYMKRHIDNIKESNNPIVQFINENIEFKLNDYLVKQEVYARYVVWSKENGYLPVGANKFGAEMYRTFLEYTPKDARNNNAYRDRIWKNLRFKKDKNSGIPLLWHD